MNSNKQFYKMSITSDFHCLEYFSMFNSIPIKMNMNNLIIYGNNVCTLQCIYM